MSLVESGVVDGRREEAKDVGVVGICIGGLYSLSVGDSIVSCCFVWARQARIGSFAG
jgi:hypothetical protein